MRRTVAVVHLGRQRFEAARWCSCADMPRGPVRKSALERRQE